MSANTGSIGLVSTPSAHANDLIQPVNPRVYRQILRQPNHPLFQRASQGLYPPGSILKPFIALQALHDHTITPKTTIQDPGFFQIPHSNHRFRDWKTEGHGQVNVAKALIVSCDTFFYWLGLKMGIQRINQGLASFGLGHASHLDLSHQPTGVLNSPTWKKQHHHRPWYLGDTVISVIGQGNTSVTPIQMAQAMTYLANRGHAKLHTWSWQHDRFKANGKQSTMLIYPLFIIIHKHGAPSFKLCVMSPPKARRGALVKLTIQWQAKQGPHNFFM